MKSYYQNNCNVCDQPQHKCKQTNCKPKNCNTSLCGETKPIPIKEWHCEKVYRKGEPVSQGEFFYVSKIDNNVGVDPTLSSRPESSLWAWDGPHCDLGTLYDALNEVNGVKGDRGEQGPQGQRGPKGDKGDTGNTGAKGDQGEQGDRGDKGDRGEKGDQGDRGIQGAQGIQGESGEQGDQGERGQQGEQGAQGIQGDRGGQGIAGEKGNQGERGEQGLTGERGEQGIQGTQGIQGIQGGKGEQGNKGDRGLPFNPETIVETLPSNFTCPATGTSSVYEASQGLLHFCIDGVLQEPVSFGRGEKGERGEQGEQGIQGEQGEQGEQGQTGERGQRGEQGTKGDQGERGLQGEVGSKGDKGDRGDRGLQGERGLQGLQGVRGLQGVQGEQGIQGERGLKGDKGDRGDRGEQGIQGERGLKGDKGDQGEIGAKGDKGDSGGPQGPVGPAPTIGENGNWFIAGNDTGVPARGPEGEAGKDYDPNCEPPVVTEITCADTLGNIALIFDDNPENVKYVRFDDFKPTPYSIHNVKKDEEGNVYTVNRNDSIVHWISGKPTTNVIPANFEAQGLENELHQLITFDLISTKTAACLAKGEWLLKLDCDNCPCVVPKFVLNKDGTVTLNDGYGLVVTLRTTRSKDGSYCLTATSDEPPVCDTENKEVCGIDELEGVSLKVKSWEKCNDGVPVGVYFYNGMLYINTQEGNTKSPTAKNSEWMGGYDYYELMQALVELFIGNRVELLKEEFEINFKKLQKEFDDYKSLTDGKLHHQSSKIDQLTEISHSLVAKVQRLEKIIECNHLDTECCEE